MQIAPVRSAAVPVATDDSLVAGLRLPSFAGLPTATTPGEALKMLLGPPKPGSDVYRADMAVVQGAKQLRTPEGDAWARRMAKDGQGSMWFDLAARLRERTGKVQGWLDTALVASTLASTASVAFLAKRVYDRERPYEVDPSLDPPVKLPHGSSYPSGHSSSAYAAARVISVLEPTLAAEAYDLARQVAVSRVYAGVHFPSDVIAGALLGTAIGEAALRLTDQPRALDAAIAELVR
ncbi:MAG: glycerophosphatase [Thermoleophilia bacterium]|nr:glycerophosphatase [Thermoleophilia bacterium]MCZ4495481.1 glycerophosphatase [Thermoleophilia bacterium]